MLFGLLVRLAALSWLQIFDRRPPTRLHPESSRNDDELVIEAQGLSGCTTYRRLTLDKCSIR